MLKIYKSIQMFYLTRKKIDENINLNSHKIFPPAICDIFFCSVTIVALFFLTVKYLIFMMHQCSKVFKRRNLEISVLNSTIAAS